MRQSRRLRTLAGLLLILGLQPLLPLQGSEDSASAELGRQLFFEGRKDGAEPVTANVGAAAIPVPATALPCAGCHGRDGEGRPEGGVRPSDITWFNLTREYGGVSEQGRRFQAYDEDRFLRAVSEGVDSSGNPLDSSMPRYNISRRDARDLIAFLKVIQNDLDPGVSNDSVVVGTLQPSLGVQARVGAAMVEVMRARFDEVNRRGGLYGRQLKLEVATFEDRQSFVATANEMIADDRVFALTGVFSSSAEAALIDMAEDTEIPSIAPYTQFPATAEGRHFNTFYLHGGLEAQLAVLAKRITQELPNAPVTVLHREGGGYDGLAENVAAQLQQLGHGSVRVQAYAADGSGRLAELVDAAANPEAAVVFVGHAAELLALLSDATQQPPVVHLYLPGYFVSGKILELPRDYAERLEMTYATVLDASEAGPLREFWLFMHRNKLEYDFLNPRLWAYSASEILLEGIKRAGKRLTRKKLVTEIEGLYSFDAGLNRPLSFTTQRRVGLSGAYIVRLDYENRKLMPTDTWVELD